MIKELSMFLDRLDSLPEERLGKITTVPTFLMAEGPTVDVITSAHDLREGWRVLRESGRRMSIAMMPNEQTAVIHAISIPNKWRLRGAKFRPMPIEQRSCYLGEDGNVAPRRSAFWDCSNNVSIPLNEVAYNFSQSAESEKFQPLFQIVGGMSNMKKTCFFCSFKYSGFPIAMFLPPENILRIFAEREKNSKGRRDALIHIVSEHVRRKPDKDEFIKISSYLRGKTACQWHDMEVKLYGPKLNDYYEYMESVKAFEEWEARCQSKTVARQSMDVSLL